MPKKQTARSGASKAPARKVVKKAVAKKAARASVARANRPSSDGKPAPTKAARKKAASASPPPTPAPAQPTLGRPLVTQEEKLYMLFHDDYQCRQVFEFLRVETVKELEEYTPQQIFHLMSRPIRLTVDRIRKRLAEFKRSLKEDEQFAADYQQTRPASAPATVGASATAASRPVAD